ncbi:MAG TPA: nuclear transport factor 2 family protein [Steroidobacteraceae bacterium]
MQRRTLLTWSGISLALAAGAWLPHRSTAAARRSAAENPAEADPLVAMFVWWNAAYQQKAGFTAEAFARHFTPDAVMRINGEDRSKGVEDLAQHFRDIKARTELVVIDLPFIDEFSSASGDRIFTHHFVRAREKGKDSRERVMGYASINDGKISLINFVSVPDA